MREVIAIRGGGDDCRPEGTSTRRSYLEILTAKAHSAKGGQGGVEAEVQATVAMRRSHTTAATVACCGSSQASSGPPAWRPSLYRASVPADAAVKIDLRLPAKIDTKVTDYRHLPDEADTPDAASSDATSVRSWSGAYTPVSESTTLSTELGQLCGNSVGSAFRLSRNEDCPAENCADVFADGGMDGHTAAEFETARPTAPVAWRALEAIPIGAQSPDAGKTREGKFLWAEETDDEEGEIGCDDGEDESGADIADDATGSPKAASCRRRRRRRGRRGAPPRAVPPSAAAALAAGATSGTAGIFPSATGSPLQGGSVHAVSRSVITCGDLGLLAPSPAHCTAAGSAALAGPPVAASVASATLPHAVAAAPPVFFAHSGTVNQLQYRQSSCLQAAAPSMPVQHGGVNVNEFMRSWLVSRGFACEPVASSPEALVAQLQAASCDAYED
eukprot:TRINITY_DN91903_c0_g1_i1.p1 TRINITY_DN91903_c0_g1~~TRINITY_DN91903_c0_g1_i1.p1  ORF type:complete len:445 (-),score=49.49 TRINITY_DN91903_c0_g1_i1:73-1407(-)